MSEYYPLIGINLGTISSWRSLHDYVPPSDNLQTKCYKYRFLAKLQQEYESGIEKTIFHHFLGQLVNKTLRLRYVLIK